MKVTLIFSSVVACVLLGLSALAATDDRVFVRIAPDEVAVEGIAEWPWSSDRHVGGRPHQARSLRTTRQIPAACDGSAPLAS